MKKGKGGLLTAKCVHCGARGLVDRDARGNPIEKMCVNGHIFEYETTERFQTGAEKRENQTASPSRGPMVAPSVPTPPSAETPSGPAVAPSTEEHGSDRG